MFQGSVAGILHWKCGLDPGPVHVTFPMKEVALRQVLLRALLFLPSVIIIEPLRTHFDLITRTIIRYEVEGSGFEPRSGRNLTWGQPILLYNGCMIFSFDEAAGVWR